MITATEALERIKASRTILFCPNPAVERILIDWLINPGWLPTVSQLALDLPGGRAIQIAENSYRQYREMGIMTAPGKHSGQPHLTAAGIEYFRERGVRFA